MTVVAWTQWPDLTLPDGVEMLGGDIYDLTPEELGRITFLVPPYMTRDKPLQLTKAMPNLRVMQVPNAGFDHAVPFVRPGMVLCNASGVHNESTAEHAVGLALAGMRGYAEYAVTQREHRWWKYGPRPSLTDSRIAIVGSGSIGTTIARMLSGFEVQTEGFSRSGSNGSTPVSALPDRIGEFDIVILILPLNDDSRGMFDADLLSRMKDGALLVNVARGGVVDTDALLAELQQGRLRAALDVTDPEPLPEDHPLWDAPGCFITPHLGGNSTAFTPRIRKLVEAQLSRFAAGEPLVNVVVDRRGETA